VYFRTKWRLHPSSRLATIDVGQKLGGVGVPFFWGSSWNTKSPEPRPTSIPSGILVHPAVCPQRTMAENWRAQLKGRGSWVSAGSRPPSLRLSSVPFLPSLCAPPSPPLPSVPRLVRLHLPLGEGKLGPHPTQCRVGRCLYFRTKRHLDQCSRLAAIDVGQKLGAPPLFGEGDCETGSPSNTSHIG